MQTLSFIQAIKLLYVKIVVFTHFLRFANDFFKKNINRFIHLLKNFRQF